MKINRARRFNGVKMKAPIIFMAGLLACLMVCLSVCRLARPLQADEHAIMSETLAARAKERGVALVDDLKGQSGAQVADDPQPKEHLRVRLSWGHKSAGVEPYRISLLTDVVQVNQIHADGLEAGDMLQDGVCQTRAGAGDVDAVTVEVSWTKPVKPPLKPQSIWQSLFDNG